MAAGPTEPVTIEDTVIEPGTPVRLLLGSANRDPDRYEDPDRFDIHRESIRHLAFGRGLHVCLGSALGRLEAQIVVPAVLRRFPDLTLVDDEPTWRPSFVVRQLADPSGGHRPGLTSVRRRGGRGRVVRSGAGRTGQPP